MQCDIYHNTRQNDGDQQNYENFVFMNPGVGF